MASLADYEQYLPLAIKFVDFVNESVTAYHAVGASKKILLDEGFVQISEKDKWNLAPNGKYFFTRNQSTIVALVVGGKYQSGNGFNIVGAHTDSPHLQLKPQESVTKEGYLQVGVQPYGGGLWPTWFDRDLTVAGRVIVKSGATYESRLVKIDRPLLRIPTLAIHLNRESDVKLEFNKQEHLLPVFAMAIESQLNRPSSHSILLHLIAQELKCDVNDIKDFEMALCDTQKATIGGVFSEFVWSPRLDNLMMSFCALTGLVEATKDAKLLAEEPNVQMALLFDNEEIGSATAHGAASPLVNDIIRRVTNSSELFEIAIRRSFLVSADMAHAVHPNYSEKHEVNHKPRIHKGVVIKHNANQRYATIASTAFILRELAARNNVPIQDFVVRNDSLCGSTIGPIIAANTGIRTVDIGNPQLSMHSIREMCGVADITHATNLLKSFYQQFTALDQTLKVD